MQTEPLGLDIVEAELVLGMERPGVTTMNRVFVSSTAVSSRNGESASPIGASWKWCALGKPGKPAGNEILMDSVDGPPVQSMSIMPLHDRRPHREAERRRGPGCRTWSVGAGRSVTSRAPT